MKRVLLFFLFLVFSFKLFPQASNPQIEYKDDPLYNFIQNWWKTPYHYGGETKYGIDCSAFTGKLFKSVYKIELPRTAKEQYNYTIRIKKNDLKDGDLVFFRTKAKSGWHVGVYLADGYFIHSKSHKGVTISNLNENLYERIYFGAGRLKNEVF